MKIPRDVIFKLKALHHERCIIIIRDPDKFMQQHNISFYILYICESEERIEAYQEDIHEDTDPSKVG